MNNVLFFPTKIKREFYVERFRKGFTYLQILAIFSLFSAFISLIYLFIVSGATYFFAAIIIGFSLLFSDFFVERKGILNNEWRYEKHPLKIKNVPVELLIFSFGMGVILTFIFNCFVESWWGGFALKEFLGMNIIQSALVFVSLYFLFQYFVEKRCPLIYGALPLGAALFYEFPEPWILSVAIVPVYLDWFVEKRMVKKREIEYDNYSEDCASVVALTYFSIAFLIFGVIGLMIGVVS